MCLVSTAPMARFALPLTLALAAVFSPLFSPAEADAQSRVLVQNFQGPRAAAIRTEAVRGLRGQSVAVLPRADLARTARRMRLRMRGDRDFARAGRALNANIFIQGRVQRRRGWHLTLSVRDGSTGQVIARSTISARNPRALGNRVRTGFWGAIAGTLGVGGRAGSAVASRDDMVFDIHEADQQVNLAAMDDEAPPPVEEREQSVEEELEAIRRQNLDGELFPTGGAMDDEVIPAMRTAPPFDAAHSPGEARLGLRFINRNFTYRDDVSGAALPYSLPFGAALAFGAELYPGALFSNGALAHIGLTFEGSHSMGMSTAGPDGVAWDTKDTTWGIGTRGRVPLGASEFGLSFGFARHSFSVDARESGGGNPDIASVSYAQLRIGADTRIRMGDINIYGAVAYRAVLDPGAIDDAFYYPGTTAQGVSFDFGVGYSLPLGFEVRADLGVEMYFLDFHPDPTVVTDVGGAVDRYIGGNLGVVWHMGPTGL